MPGATETLHGVFLEILGMGVLIAGRSGVGKSELALELLSRGHRLIADDAAEFFLDEHGRPEGRCPELLRGFLEVRGLGVLNVERMYGESVLLPRHRLDLILQLQVRRDLTEPPDRLHGRRSTKQVLGVDVPQITLVIRLGYNIAALAEAAARDRKLRDGGYDAAEDFAQRLQYEIDRQTVN